MLKPIGTKSSALVLLSVLVLTGLGMVSPCVFADEESPTFVRVSPRDCRYLELSDGTPYIPTGINMIHPRWHQNEEIDGFAEMEGWMKSLSENGGNYMRVWLSAGFWDIEHTKAGVYDAEKIRRVDRLLDLAKKYNIRVKMTVEHFREVDPENVRQQWASKFLHHLSRGGTASNMESWMTNPASREQFKKKLGWYAARYGNQPYVYGWELWNEMNAVRGKSYLEWTAEMLPELRRLFSENLVMQSCGSFDSERGRATYKRLATMPGNDVAQVHRYLDLGARLEVCHGPVDVLAADAVRELLAFNPRRPVILAESGAVEPRHSGPFKLYAKDKAGIILHDVLFAPFFAGAAGAGQCWHWGNYVDDNNLWHIFKHFSEAVRGINPSTEQFKPMMVDHDRLRIYALKGINTTLLWCRDKHNNWKTELEQEVAPEVLEGARISLKTLAIPKDSKVKMYDPWNDTWHDGDLSNGYDVQLPKFSRSIVVKLLH